MNPTKRIYLAIEAPHLGYVLAQVFSDPGDNLYTLTTEPETADVVLSDHMTTSSKPLGILSSVPQHAIPSQKVWFARPYSLQAIIDLLDVLN